VGVGGDEASSVRVDCVALVLDRSTCDYALNTVIIS
jgi:hypothetical protein